MTTITAQVSLYPLREKEIGPQIRALLRILKASGLHVRMGEMSTLVWGEEATVFAALHEGFHHAAMEGDTVMTMTISNACPSPEEPAREHEK